MKKELLALIFSLAQMAIASASDKTIVCTMQGLRDTILFTTHQEGDLPKIDFLYPVDTTIFSMREKNLLLVAMDHEDKSRLRILISAQASQNSFLYKGQFMTDSGGNQIQLDNGPVSCNVK